MASEGTKKYFWLKLKKDFFDQHQIKVLKSMRNGRIYALIYIELMLESVSHEGKLRLSDKLPYDENTLSAVIGEDKKMLSNALNVLLDLGLVEQWSDGTYYIKEVEKLIGCETKEALRKRDYREKTKGTLLGQCPTQDGTNLGQSHPESRVKSLESRDKSLDYLSSSSKNLKSIWGNILSDASKLDEAEEEMKKAIFATGIYPSIEKYEEIFNHVVSDNISNIPAYITKALKNSGGNK